MLLNGNQVTFSQSDVRMAEFEIYLRVFANNESTESKGSFDYTIALKDTCKLSVLNLVDVIPESVLFKIGDRS